MKSFFSFLMSVGLFVSSIAFAEQAEAPKCGEASKAPVVSEAQCQKAADGAVADLATAARPVIPPAIGKTTPAGWFDDWNKACFEARRTNRPMLVLFTGSDWCPACISLHKDILDKPAFKKFAEEKLILVYMDMPRRTELPESLQKTRDQVWHILKPGNYVPTTILTSPAGERWESLRGVPEYIDLVKKVLAEHGF